MSINYNSSFMKRMKENSPLVIPESLLCSFKIQSGLLSELYSIYCCRMHKEVPQKIMFISKHKQRCSDTFYTQPEFEYRNAQKIIQTIYKLLKYPFASNCIDRSMETISKHYSQAACIEKCLQEKQLKICGDVPHYFKIINRIAKQN